MLDRDPILLLALGGFFLFLALPFAVLGYVTALAYFGWVAFALVCVGSLPILTTFLLIVAAGFQAGESDD